MKKKTPTRGIKSYKEGRFMKILNLLFKKFFKKPLIILAILIISTGCATKQDDLTSKPTKEDWKEWERKSQSVSQVTPLITSKYTDDLPDVSNKGDILFRRKNGNSNIWFRKNNGAGVSKLTSNNAGDISPVFHPDGETFFMLSNRTGDLNIFEGNLNRRTFTLLTEVSDPALIWDGDVNKEGTKLVYPSGDYIWLYNLETGRRTQIAVGQDPTFGPDGKIFYVKKAAEFDLNQGTRNAYSIWKTDDRGRKTVLISGGPKATYSKPDISPNGERICFSKQSSAKGYQQGVFEYNTDIWVSDINGSNQMRVTTAPGLDTDCSWATNKSIVFATTRPRPGNEEGGNWDIWMMRLSR